MSLASDRVRDADGTEPSVPPAEEEQQQGWIRRLLPYLTARKADLLLVFASAVSGQVITAVIPLIKKSIVDDSILAQRRPLTGLLATLLVLAVVRYGISYVRRYFGARVGIAVEYELRNVVYDHLQRLDFARHDEMQTGQLVSRASGDVRMVQTIMSYLPTMSANVIFFFVSLTLMWRLARGLTLVALVIVPLLVVMAIRMRRIVYPSSWDAQAKAAEVANVVEEAVTGVRVVKGFGQERRELGRLIDAAGTLFGARMRNIRISARRQATMGVVPSIGQLAILGYGGWLAIQDQLTIGTFLAFTTYLTMLIAPVRMFAMMLVQAQNTRAAAERIFEILDSTPIVVEKPDAVSVDSIAGDIRFDDVTFGYVRSEPILRGFSLHVRPGEVVALVGGSGSGKSTVSLLLPRFYDVHTGSITVDGTDIRDVKLDSLRSQIGVVFEESFLFSDSVRNNIAYGRPEATMEDVVAAAKAAEAHEFILELPEGYDTVVGERGLTLSGGQRQRVALARALLTDPRMLLLDDATSSIDARIEEEIHATLKRVMPGRSVILVAHRRSTLDLADRIVVLEGGQVLDAGTHEELNARCRLYRELLSGPEGSAEAEPDKPRWDGRRTASAWQEAPADLEALQSLAMPSAGGGFGALVGGLSGGAGGAGRGMRMGRGGGGGGSGGGMRFSRGGRLNAPPTEELAKAIEALPPVTDEPDVDRERETAPMADFRLPPFVRPYARYIAFAIVLVTFESLAQLAAPAVIRWGVDAGIIQKQPRVLWVMCGVFFASIVISRMLAWVVAIYTGRLGQRLLFALRLRVFSQLQRLALDYYDRELAGRIMTRMTSDIEAMHSLLQSGLIRAVIQVVTFVGTAAILATMNLRLTLYVLLIAPPLAVATQRFRKKSDVAYLKARDRLATVNANFQESISGVRVAQAFVRERHNIEEFRRVTRRYLDARMESQRLASTFFPFVELLSTIAMIVVLGAGAQMVAQGTLTAGALIAFVLYINTVFGPIQQLSGIFDTYQQAKAALTRLGELMATPLATPPAATPSLPPRLSGDIRFESVTFRYVGTTQDALTDVSLRIEPGQTVALVGETGAGKSTIVKLVARFYDPTSGRVLIDGLPLTDLDLHSFRQQLGYVPQEAFLFSGTIRDNIAYGKPEATDEEVEAAARAVGAHDFIAKLPYGYNQPVTERGRSLSAGQRQLIALARALVVDPAILILDEATANLDLATEAKVAEAMGMVSEGRTTILIAHRLQTARRADRIMVLHKGRLAEEGRHEELVAAGGRYADLWRSFAMESTPAP